jgi:hypothetical protein
VRPPEELVVHLGLPGTGGRQVVRALSAARPRLREHGVSYVRPQRSGSPQERAAEVAARARAERRRTASRADGGQTVLVGDRAMLGPVGSPEAPGVWWPHADRALAPLLDALAPVRASLVLVVRRQDRWLEDRHTEDVLDGSVLELDAWRARLPGPAPDLEDLADRLSRLAGVDRVEVLPAEVGDQQPVRLVQHVLAAAGLGGLVPEGKVERTRPHGTTARGLAVARALGPELETDDERRLVRRFVLDTFPPGAGEAAVLPLADREAVLSACAAANRRLLARHQPAVDPDAYADDERTARLAATPAPSSRVQPFGRPNLRGRAYAGWDRARSRLRNRLRKSAKQALRRWRRRGRR